MKFMILTIDSPWVITCYIAACFVRTFRIEYYSYGKERFLSVKLWWWGEECFINIDSNGILSLLQSLPKVHIQLITISNYPISKLNDLADYKFRFLSSQALLLKKYSVSRGETGCYNPSGSGDWIRWIFWITARSFVMSLSILS